MPLHQVVTDANGNKSLALVSGSITSDSAAEAKELAQAAYAKAEAAETTAGNALPKTGGTMTGAIVSRLGNVDLTQDALQAQNALLLTDKNSKRIAAFYGERLENQTSELRVSAYSPDDEAAFATLYLGYNSAKSMPYLAGPFAPDEFGTYVDTVRDSALRHKNHLPADSIVHIGGENASDTADLFRGRGFDADKPFASLLAAFSFIGTNYEGDVCRFRLHEDMAFSATPTSLRLNPAVRSYLLESASYSALKKLLIPGTLTVLDGVLDFSYLNVEITGGAALIVNGTAAPAVLRFSNTINISGTNWSIRSTGAMANMIFSTGEMSFSGTANASGFIHCYALGNVQVVGNPVINGPDATGRRYYVRSGGRIITGGKGAEFFPGTEAGDTDSISIYA